MTQEVTLFILMSGTLGYIRNKWHIDGNMPLGNRPEIWSSVRATSDVR
jgi:hypothetical protein